MTYAAAFLSLDPLRVTPPACLACRRFALEVARAVCGAVGAQRVGMRLAPFNTYLDVGDDTPYATHMYLVGDGGRVGGAA